MLFKRRLQRCHDDDGRDGFDDDGALHPPRQEAAFLTLPHLAQSSYFTDARMTNLEGSILQEDKSMLSLKLSTF